VVNRQDWQGERVLRIAPELSLHLCLVFCFSINRNQQREGSLRIAPELSLNLCFRISDSTSKRAEGRECPGSLLVSLSTLPKEFGGVWGQCLELHSLLCIDPALLLLAARRLAPFLGRLCLHLHHFVLIGGVRVRDGVSLPLASLLDGLEAILKRGVLDDIISE